MLEMIKNKVMEQVTLEMTQIPIIDFTGHMK